MVGCIAGTQSSREGRQILGSQDENIEERSHVSEKPFSYTKEQNRPEESGIQRWKPGGRKECG